MAGVTTRSAVRSDVPDLRPVRPRSAVFTPTRSRRRSASWGRSSRGASRC
jgi:hypothetical protein